MPASHHMVIERYWRVIAGVVYSLFCVSLGVTFLYCNIQERDCLEVVDRQLQHWQAFFSSSSTKRAQESCETIDALLLSAPSRRIGAFEALRWLQSGHTVAKKPVQHMNEEIEHQMGDKRGEDGRVMRMMARIAEGIDVYITQNIFQAQSPSLSSTAASDKDELQDGALLKRRQQRRLVAALYLRFRAEEEEEEAVRRGRLLAQRPLRHESKSVLVSEIGEADSMPLAFSDSLSPQLTVQYADVLLKSALRWSLFQEESAEAGQGETQSPSFAAAWKARPTRLTVACVDAAIKMLKVRFSTSP